MTELKRSFEDQIYRPGDEIGELEDLSDDEQRQRFEEIEQAFAEANISTPKAQPSDPDFEPDNGMVTVGIR